MGKNKRHILNILIGGEAGQGIVTVGNLLSKSLVRSGYSIVVTQDYQSRIRGGHNTFSIRVGTDKVVAPQEQADILVALDRDTVAFHRSYLSPNGLVVLDDSLGVDDDSFLKVPFKEISPKEFSNIAALGVVCSLLGLNESLVSEMIGESLGGGEADLSSENSRIFIAATAWTDINAPSSYRLATPVNTINGQLMMNGNEAIALGAIAGGMKFAAFYPMTPATSIVLNLVHHAKKLNLIVEQAEDEIAAINMAIGASFAGAPSMVATSGGGFALMTEGISLAAMTETPVVVAVAQRPGPATGLPTRTEQADLEFVLHAGHGEFPRAIFTPGTVEECFYLTSKAFEMAEKYQGPMFLLTDQFLADSYRAVAPFDIENSPKANPARPIDISSPYKRYEITENGISPRLFPGITDNLVVGDSDEHTEDGHITEDLSVRKQMVEKRLRKGEGILEEVIPPDFRGEDASDILLISWGSSMGAVREAAARLRSDGEKVATLHFSQVWPLKSSQFMNNLEGAREVIAIESNATGQFSRLIRRETGFHIKRKILRYDGLPLTPEYILEGLKQIQVSEAG